jgi:lipopolysaccharide transport system permease protein
VHVPLRELRDRREVALVLALRELKLRYKQTLLGVAWVVVQPLAGVVVFSVLFGTVADLPSDGLPYPVFVFSGLLIWSYFQASVAGATQSLVESRELVTKIYFPRLLVPLAAVLPRLIDLGLALVVLAGVMIVYGVAPSPAIVLFPVVLALTITFTLGVGLWLSAFHVRFRDAGVAITFVLQLWLYLSPVVFPSSLAEGWLRVLLSVNPVTGLVDLARWTLVAGKAPPPEDLISLAVGAMVVAGGLFYFGRTERRFADLI